MGDDTYFPLMSTLNLNAYGERGAYDSTEQDTDTSFTGMDFIQLKISFPGSSGKHHF